MIIIHLHTHLFRTFTYTKLLVGSILKNTLKQNKMLQIYDNSEWCWCTLTLSHKAVQTISSTFWLCLSQTGTKSLTWYTHLTKKEVFCFLFPRKLNILRLQGAVLENANTVLLALYYLLTDEAMQLQSECTQQTII